MKKLVVFSTLTGNTEKIANAIFSVIEGDKKILSIKDIHNIDIDDYDRIAIGYWVDKGDADEMTKKLISRIKGKNIGTFGTLGADPLSEHAGSCVSKVRKALEDNGNIVEKEFICRGAISPQLIERFRKMTREGMEGHHAVTPESEKRWAEAAKHPDENDIKNAKEAFKDF